MAYLAELRAAWRPLAGATIGMASGMSLVGVVTSTIAPTLLTDTQWSRADYAMVGSLALVMSFVFPFIGRLADVIGVRLTALIGQVLLPLTYLGYSFIGRQLWIYVVIFGVQTLFCVTTTSTVYTRIPVQYVRHARGLALAVVASGPALAGIVVSPLLNAYVEADGWRAAYRMVALFTALAGLVSFLLIPREPRADPARATAPRRSARADYPVIFRTPALWILLASMLLVNLPQTILLVQLKLLLLANGVAGEGVAVMLSAASVGMLAGRFVTGVALDRLRTTIVSFLGLGLPSVGLFLFASSLDGPWVLTFAVFAIGFATGAEGDIVGFLVARHFGVDVYSSTLGILTAAMSFSSAMGATLLSLTLARTGGYETYLMICGTAVLAGATLTLLLGRGRPPQAQARAVPKVVPNADFAGTGRA